MNEYFNTIKTMIVDKTGADPEDINEESCFEDDLNIGEMELVEILTDLEDIYGIDLVEEKDNIETVQDIVDILIENAE